jgi:hypothetical protein
MEKSIVEKKLIPYSVYLPKEYHDKISGLAKQRRASGLIRDAICVMLDGGDQYRSGYNQALRDIVSQINKIKVIKDFSYKGLSLDEIVLEQIGQLK